MSVKLKYAFIYIWQLPLFKATYIDLIYTAEQLRFKGLSQEPRSGRLEVLFISFINVLKYLSETHTVSCAGH